MNLGQTETYLDKTDDFDTVLVGSSYTMSFFADEITRSLGSKGTLKLCLGGGYPMELEVVLVKALRSHRVKHVLFGFDLFTFVLPDHTPHPTRASPHRLYKRKYSALCNIHNIDASLRMLLYQFGCKNVHFRQAHHATLNELYYWFDRSCLVDRHAAFTSSEDLQALRTNCFRYDHYEYKPSRKAFSAIDVHLLPIIKTNPEVQFHVLIMPYSWAHFATRDEAYFSRSLDCQRYLIQQLDGVSNATVYGFQTCIFAKNLYNYNDTDHFHPEVNRYMLYAVEYGRHRLTVDNLPAYEQKMVEQIRNFQVRNHYDNYDALEEIIRQESDNLP
jgi:hypothetical protein